MLFNNLQNPLMRSPKPCSVSDFLTNAIYCFLASYFDIPSLDFQASHLYLALKFKDRNPGLSVLISPTVACL